MDQFFPRYFMGLGDALKDLGSRKLIQKQVFFAVTQMESNQDPGKLLSEIFADNFYAPLGTTEAAHKENILEFYRVEYPKLKPLTNFRPEAPELVNWCQQQNHQFAILTNPVFPEVATNERVVWAGLNPEAFPFITTYEYFHFTKPSMAYYAECLGRLGWPEGKVVMIGDDPMRDIEPMQALGYPTFQIHPESNGYHGNEGTIADVRAWLETILSQPDTEPQFSPEANLAIMRATPAVIDYWLRFLPKETFQASPEDSDWTLTEIFWHLADLEQEVFLPFWENIASDTASLIKVPDTSHWVKERHYRSKDPNEAYQKLYKNRMTSLEILEGLLKQNKHTKPIQPPVYDQTTLAGLMAFVSRHDRTHLRQSRAALII